MALDIKDIVLIVVEGGVAEVESSEHEVFTIDLDDVSIGVCGLCGGDIDPDNDRCDSCGVDWTDRDDYESILGQYFNKESVNG